MALKKVEIKRGIFPDAKPQPGQELSSQREFTFFAKPRWKKLTEYEKLLLYAQPNPDWIPGGLDWGDWPQRFPGGRDVWGNYFTELRCQDWYAFRDPAKRWQFVYVSEKGDEWRVLRRRLAAYADLELWRGIAPWWRDEILSRVWGAFLHHEYGVFNTLSSVARDALSDVIRTAVSTAAFDKLDNAQMIQMEKLFLAKLMPEGFNADIEHAKNFWLTSPLYAAAFGWRGTGILTCSTTFWATTLSLGRTTGRSCRCGWIAGCPRQARRYALFKASTTGVKPRLRWSMRRLSKLRRDCTA
jgi:hypothetical protein